MERVLSLFIFVSVGKMADVSADPLPVELEETLATFDANVEELATYLQPLLNADYAALQVLSIVDNTTNDINV